ncbi:MAG: manganese efflux pump [Bacteroidales bacterium]|nr:manganese efflux pump [Bacteroidales bacterium]
MSILELIFLSIALAMDCFAVSFSAGGLQKELRLRHALVIGSFFGLFQGMMPLIGYFGGQAVVSYIERFDHWVAFGILLILGLKMMFEALRPEKGGKGMNIMKPTTLLVLSIATSIDALAVGFSFSMLDVRIWIAVLIIGIGSFIFSVGGFYMGKFLSNRLKPTYAEILGGVILIIIGVKILIEHLNM